MLILFDLDADMLRVLVLALWAAGNASFLDAQRTPEPVATCHDVSLARPAYGVSYRGSVRNSDYEFSAMVPEGFTGWGAAPVAPFHGFTIYLDERETSCIVFEIRLRVGDVSAEQDAAPNEAAPIRVRVGNRSGLQTVVIGRRSGVEYQNVTVTLELPRAGYTNDAEIVLVTPMNEVARTKPIFSKFLGSFKFN
ncbi:MAG TPA: hypothetical protein VMB85_27145 [Bryobacteraceae bacterium]|nr:hypothetical protein [Bryobacteraceae bacterium]